MAERVVALTFGKKRVVIPLIGRTELGRLMETCYKAADTLLGAKPKLVNVQ